MKFNEAVPFHPHSQIILWINAAKHQAIHDIIDIMKDESSLDRNWFLTGRKSRLKQLASEIFTIKLIDVSDHKWSVRDFEGKDHSTLVTSAIADVTNVISAKYRELASTMPIDTTVDQ